MAKQTAPAKTPDEKLNIYQKLLKIQEEIKGLAKDKDTASPENKKGYKYVTGDKVLDNIKPIMNAYGLILKQEILSIENVRQDYTTRYGVKAEILSKVMMRFTWVDCESGEKDENLFGANGQNDWDKGVGSALTYGERYFLLKFFHIATDEDDIDNPDRKTEGSDQSPEETYNSLIKSHEEALTKIELVPALTTYFNALSNELKADQNIINLIKSRRSALTPAA